MVCNNTLVGRNISKDQVVLEARVVPSGVAEIGRPHSQVSPGRCGAGRTS